MLTVAPSCHLSKKRQLLVKLPVAVSVAAGGAGDVVVVVAFPSLQFLKTPPSLCRPSAPTSMKTYLYALSTTAISTIEKVR